MATNFVEYHLLVSDDGQNDVPVDSISREISIKMQGPNNLNYSFLNSDWELDVYTCTFSHTEAARFQENQQMDGISDGGQNNSFVDFIPRSCSLDDVEIKEEPLDVKHTFDGVQNDSPVYLIPKENYVEDFEIKEECVHVQQTLCKKQSLTISKVGI